MSRIRAKPLSAENAANPLVQIFTQQNLGTIRNIILQAIGDTDEATCWSLKVAFPQVIFLDCKSVYSYEHAYYASINYKNKSGHQLRFVLLNGGINLSCVPGWQLIQHAMKSDAPCQFLVEIWTMHMTESQRTQCTAGVEQQMLDFIPTNPGDGSGILAFIVHNFATAFLVADKHAHSLIMEKFILQSIRKGYKFPDILQLHNATDAHQRITMIELYEQGWKNKNGSVIRGSWEHMPEYHRRSVQANATVYLSYLYQTNHYIIFNGTILELLTLYWNHIGTMKIYEFWRIYMNIICYTNDIEECIPLLRNIYSNILQILDEPDDFRPEQRCIFSILTQNFYKYQIEALYTLQRYFPEILHRYRNSLMGQTHIAALRQHTEQVDEEASAKLKMFLLRS